MASIKGTQAKVGADGVWAHRHMVNGQLSNWHWACAGHRDNGAIHKAAKATSPVFPDGTSEAKRQSYANAVNRKDGYVSKIASKKEKAVHVKA